MYLLLFLLLLVLFVFWQRSGEGGSLYVRSVFYIYIYDCYRQWIDHVHNVSISSDCSLIKSVHTASVVLCQFVI